MLKELLFEKEEIPHYKKEWRFRPEWTLTGLNTPVCVQWLIDKSVYTVGKEKDNDGILNNNRTVSDRHMLVRSTEEGCFVEDNGSNGDIYVNAQPIGNDGPVQVRNGDVLRLGNVYFVLEKIRWEDRT